MKSVYLFLLLPFFLLATPTPSRNNSRIAQIFTTVNGLPDNTINDIQKDKEGYLWIATNKGIARFDGKNFISFSNFFSASILPEKTFTLNFWSRSCAHSNWVSLYLFLTLLHNAWSKLDHCKPVKTCASIAFIFLLFELKSLVPRACFLLQKTLFLIWQQS